MKRVPTLELLDSDAGTPAEIAGTLADLRLVNRWFGGTSTMAQLVERVAGVTGARQLSFLDVGSASGDVAESVRCRMESRGIHFAVTVLDRAPLHLAANPAARRVVGDGSALPFRSRSFDLVGCSLVAHHLGPEELPRFVDECLRVGRVAALINDLRRSPMHLALVYAGYPLYRSRLTRHDGPASVRQAYTMEEMNSLLQRTAAGRVEIFKHYLYRMGVIAWKHQP